MASNDVATPSDESMIRLRHNLKLAGKLPLKLELDGDELGDLNRQIERVIESTLHLIDDPDSRKYHRRQRAISRMPGLVEPSNVDLVLRYPVSAAVFKLCRRLAGVRGGGTYTWTVDLQKAVGDELLWSTDGSGNGTTDYRGRGLLFDMHEVKSWLSGEAGIPRYAMVAAVKLSGVADAATLLAKVTRIPRRRTGRQVAAHFRSKAARSARTEASHQMVHSGGIGMEAIQDAMPNLVHDDGLAWRP